MIKIIVSKLQVFFGFERKTKRGIRLKIDEKLADKNTICNKKPLHISLKQLEFISYFEQYLHNDNSNKFSLHFLENLEASKIRNAANILLEINTLKKTNCQ